MAIFLTPFSGKILAIETSCDETSIAIVQNSSILANVISSQVELHARWGGIVPEAAARAHVEALLPTLSEALAHAETSLDGIEAVAVTNRPGLIGALSVGLSAAKALALVLDVPLIGIHHLEGHIFSPWVDRELICPNVCLIASGGHTELIEVMAPGEYRVIGATLDDAAGEAFDKGARLLGFGYPGGKAIELNARNGDSQRYPLPRARLPKPFDFSFSGLKTAMLRCVEKEGANIRLADASASLQAAIVDPLCEKTIAAAESNDIGTITVVGGVSANQLLRTQLEHLAQKSGIKVVVPSLELCTDNAAMIGLAASFRLGLGEHDDFELDCFANAKIPGCVN